MRMRRRFLGMLLIVSVALCGCQNSEDVFLSYQKTSSSRAEVFDNHLMEREFFAKDIAIATEEDNVGGDEELTIGASLLINKTDTQVIYADKVYDKLYPASLTKLLTALVVFRYGEITDMVTIGNNAANIGVSGVKLCGFKEGDTITLEALLNCMLIYSGNDAAIAVAEHVGGNVEAFVELMNEEAHKIGAVHSNFVNPHGLHDEDQYSTAYDLYLIFNELLQYDTFRNIISTSSYTANYNDREGNAKDMSLRSTNLYLRDGQELDSGIKIIGGKTGTTNKAGNCLVLLSKGKSEKEYISVILKASDSDELYTQMSYLLTTFTN